MSADPRPLPPNEFARLLERWCANVQAFASPNMGNARRFSAE